MPERVRASGLDVDAHTAAGCGLEVTDHVADHARGVEGCERAG